MAFDSTGFIPCREKPLVLYVFSTSETIQKLMLSNTTSGGSCINDTMVHLSGTGIAEAAATTRSSTYMCVCVCLHMWGVCCVQFLRYLFFRICVCSWIGSLYTSLKFSHVLSLLMSFDCFWSCKTVPLAFLLLASKFVCAHKDLWCMVESKTQHPETETWLRKCLIVWTV